MSEVPIRSIRVPVVLVSAAIVGFAIGTWLGNQGRSDVPQASPTASAAPPSPSITVTPSPSASATPSATAPASPSTVPAQPGTILQISGTGDEVSDPFGVLPGWQIQWRAEGATFKVDVTGDQIIGNVVDEPGPATGVISLAQSGTFILTVTADGPWSITVVQGGG